MPYGVECDQYSVLGEITECHIVKNRLTEEICVMTLNCNELSFDVCINVKDCSVNLKWEDGSRVWYGFREQ